MIFEILFINNVAQYSNSFALTCMACNRLYLHFGSTPFPFPFHFVSPFSISIEIAFINFHRLWGCVDLNAAKGIGFWHIDYYLFAHMLTRRDEKIGSKLFRRLAFEYIVGSLLLLIVAGRPHKRRNSALTLSLSISFSLNTSLRLSWVIRFYVEQPSNLRYFTSDEMHF